MYGTNIYRKIVNQNLKNKVEVIMKKMCRVCGLTVESGIRECPNCGSYDLEIIKSERERSERFRIGKWK